MVKGPRPDSARDRVSLLKTCLLKVRIASSSFCLAGGVGLGMDYPPVVSEEQKIARHPVQVAAVGFPVLLQADFLLTQDPEMFEDLGDHQEDQGKPGTDRQAYANKGDKQRNQLGVVRDA